MAAIGYIRQSKRADLDVALSYDSQLGAIRRLAERDGTDPDAVQILADMGRSGAAGKEKLRPGYQAVLEAVGARAVDTIYALSMSRVARSTVELQNFYKACVAAGVRVVYEKEAFNFATASGKMHAQVLATFYEFERDLAVERAQGNVAQRRARGERMGRIPYGERPGDQPDAILQAWEDANGSLNATALLLNQRKVKSWSGKHWTGPAVRLVMMRLVPGILPNRAMRGVKPTSPFLLYRLLKCNCGRILTASRDGRGNREAIYRCHDADVRTGHPRPYRVRESEVLPWVRERVDGFYERLREQEGDRIAVDVANEAARAKLETERDRVIDQYTDGTIKTKPERDRRLAPIDAAISALVVETQTRDLPPIDWDKWDAADINAILTEIFESIDLGPDMTPVKARWKVTEKYIRSNPLT